MATQKWKQRITRYGDADPEQLLANPKNWRIHPKAQQDALSGVLKDVGVVQNVIVNERTGFVVDGHLRVSLALRDKQPALPVTYVDLSEDEEALILATLDPLGAMAATDAQKLDELLREVSSGDADVMQMLADLAEANGVIPADWGGAFNSLPDGDKSPFQQMTFTVHDDQVDVISRAISAAKQSGEFANSPNENSNGNALFRICEAYVNA